MACRLVQPDVQAELDTLSLREVLDADSRPTFVLDLDPDLDPTQPADLSRKHVPVFCNEALRLHERLLEAVTSGTPAAEEPAPSTSTSSTFDEFKAWMVGVTPHDKSKDVFPVAFFYGDVLWTGSTVRQRWRLISGNQAWRKKDAVKLTPTPPRPEPFEEVSGGGGQRSLQDTKIVEATPTETVGSPTVFSQNNTNSYYPPKSGSHSEETGLTSYASSIPLSSPDKAVADWTIPEPKGILSPHLQHARAVDWAKTPLGPMQDWSREFRQAANLVMKNPHPAALFWGSELTMLYNEAYAAEVAGNKHPSLMGTGFSGPFAELWDYAGPIFAECARTGTSVRKDHDYLPIDRKGIIEETFYSWSFTPLYGGTSRILGFYNAPFETTKEVVNQRRMKTVNQLGERIYRAKTIKQFWTCVLESLEDNHYDVPFALLYSVGEGEENDVSSVSSESTATPKFCQFEGALGVPEGHPTIPIQLDLKRSRGGFVPSFREAMRTREPTVLNTRDGSLPEELLEGFHWRGFGDACRQAVIFPIRPTNGDNVMAFLVLGVAPRRVYDNEYAAFVQMLNRQLATSLASVMLYEDEVRKSRDAAEAAAFEKEHLAQQLELQASRMRRMTELSPLGMFLINPESVLLEANEQFYEMTGHSRELQFETTWMNFIDDNSLETIREGWDRMRREHGSWSGELKLKKRHPSLKLQGEVMDYWVLFSAHAETDNAGMLRSIMGSITDISHLKWAQGLQNRRLKEAEETRRRQNEFIDITSHEMRNPLSAILQCADDILASLEEYTTTSPPLDVVSSCIEAASTISLCVQHQKAIVDDVLTISKLDSNLLLITPVTSQPALILKRAVRMFEPELQAKGIQVEYESLLGDKDVDLNWVMLDPSRVLQILINLITNAIKFTTPSARRTITVSVSASVVPPDGSHIPDFTFVPSNTEGVDITDSQEWGTGDVIYVRFHVRDTGCGLTPEEMKILFQRFKQASPRTHAVYGGSGLGLFISKRLVELHGGKIGVASKAGEGSLFGFYIQARRCTSPRSSLDTQEPPRIAQSVGTAMTRLTQPFTPHPENGAVASKTGTSSTATTPPAFSLEELYVLVVEDNLINQKVLMKQLQKIGCKVNVANDGIEALAFLKQTHFCAAGGQRLSVILMDLEMPNMDGLTCVREIRAMQRRDEIATRVPVVAVTANVRDQQIKAAMTAGMDDVVSKPFRIPDLVKKVEALLQAMA